MREPPVIEPTKPVTVTYTHKGWFGMCPVYLGNLGGPAPDVLERHPSLIVIMLISEALFGLLNLLSCAINPKYQPGWPLLVTSELKPHKVMTHHHEDHSS